MPRTRRQAPGGVVFHVLNRACSRPYGTPAWQVRTAKELNLEASMRPPGRPPPDPKAKEQ